MATCPVQVSTSLKLNWVEPVGKKAFLTPCEELGKAGSGIVPLTFNFVISTIKGFDQAISKDLIAHSSKTL